MSNTSARRGKKRRKKQYHPLAYLLAFVLIIGLLLLLVLALRSGYNIFVKSTYELAYYDEVMDACEDFGVEPSLAYAIMRTESGFDESAHSGADAKGLMQVTDVTLEWLWLRSDEFDNVTSENLYDGPTNLRCGIYTLSLLFEQFENEQTVIAAYNAGIGVVQEWLTDDAYSSDGVTLHTIPFAETEAYVQRVESAKAIYEDYYDLG